MAAQRGVNLGGWLVLERWMTPKLFAGTSAHDEYSWMQTPGAAKALNRHRGEFIQESDFQWMASHGVDIIRIPLGYWIFDGDHPYVGGLPYLDWAMNMAVKYRIKVLLCLHGAPGSQNGNHHSGRIGVASWYDSASYRERTVDVLVRLAERYKAHSSLWGIELLNEPRTRLFQRKLRIFYKQAQAALEEILPPYVNIVFHDAFTPRLLNGAIAAKSNPVTLDVHWYHFTYWAFRWTPLNWYFKFIILWHGKLIRKLNRRQPVVIGEWSGALAGEQLNKYKQSRHTELCNEHIQRQRAVYDNAAAWFYWTYKTQERGIWNYRSLVEDYPGILE